MVYSRRLTALILFASLQLLARGAVANPRLEVTFGAAFIGLYGLEVTVSPCSLPLDVVLPGPSGVSGLYEACRTVRAQDIEITSPEAVFRAGHSVVLENGFRVAEDASFEASVDPMLSPFAWVEDHTPLAEETYRASYYVNLDGLPLVAGGELHNLVGLSSGDPPQFRVFFQRDDQSGESRLLLAARLDTGSEALLAWQDGLPLPGGWNQIEIDWKAAPGTGHLAVTLNGSTSTELTDLANDNGAIHSVRWGVVASDGPLAFTSGMVYLDDFSSFR